MRNKRKRTFKQSLTAVVVVGVLFLILVMQIGAGAIGYIEFALALKSQYRNTADILVKAISNTVTTENLERYLETGTKDVDYYMAEKRMKNIVESSGSHVVYVAKVDVKERKRIYIYDVVSDDSGFSPYGIGYTDTCEEGFLKGYQTFLDGKEDQENYMYSDWVPSVGDFTTMVAPLYNEEHQVVAVCAVVMPMTALTEARKGYLSQLMVWAILLSVFVGVSWYWLMRRKVVLPLRQIADESIRFSLDQTISQPRLSEQVKSHSEIGELAASLDQMEDTIVSNVERLVKLTAEKNRLSAEMNIATKIQESALPQIREGFPGRKEIDVAAMMTPAREVGGDFYDFFFVDEDHFALVIADVSGKGIPAALFMMISKVLIKTGCINGQADPGEVLTLINQKMCENNETGMFVTVWLAILELSTGVVKAVNAGHEFPAITGKDGRFELMKDKHGFVLGGMPGVQQKTYTFRMNPGDKLFVYTDGVAEAMDVKKNQFGTIRMLAALNKNLEATPEQIIDQVILDIEEFVDKEEQFDDTTMLCVRYNGS